MTTEVVFSSEVKGQAEKRQPTGFAPPGDGDAFAALLAAFVAVPDGGAPGVAACFPAGNNPGFSAEGGKDDAGSPELWPASPESFAPAGTAPLKGPPAGGEPAASFFSPEAAQLFRVPGVSGGSALVAAEGAKLLPLGLLLPVDTPAGSAIPGEAGPQAFQPGLPETAGSLSGQPGSTLPVEPSAAQIFAGSGGDSGGSTFLPGQTTVRETPFAVSGAFFGGGSSPGSVPLAGGQGGRPDLSPGGGNPPAPSSAAPEGSLSGAFAAGSVPGILPAAAAVGAAAGSPAAPDDGQPFPGMRLLPGVNFSGPGGESGENQLSGLKGSALRAEGLPGGRGEEAGRHVSWLPAPQAAGQGKDLPFVSGGVFASGGAENSPAYPLGQLAAVITRVLADHRQGQTVLKVKLEPPHLGEVTVRLALDSSNRLRVSFYVAEQAAKELIADNLTQLQHHLQIMNPRLEGVSVQIGREEGGSLSAFFAGERYPEGGGSGEHGPPGRGAPFQGAPDAAGFPPERPAAASRAGLNLLI